MMKTIVVGDDGSDCATGALDRAAQRLEEWLLATDHR